jgi:4'-phosphopantetheinyl transferase
MQAWAWLSRSHADVPADDGWLGARERMALDGLKVEKRRADWRLGRFTAKAAAAAWLGVPAGEVEILAAPDGAPDAWIGDELAPVSLSLSHRAGRAAAVVADAYCPVGCDIELIEPRSDQFVREWFSPWEQELVFAAGERQHLLANLLWTAKEAAVKARREGLRLDPRHAVVDLGNGSWPWRPLSVTWDDEPWSVDGWWREYGGFVLAVVAERLGLAAPDDLLREQAHSSRRFAPRTRRAGRR